VLLASRVSILSGIHQHGTENKGVPIRDQKGQYEVMQIEEDSWIGEGAVVGAHIGKHSIVAAGSVILRDVSPESIAVGNPARVTAKRKK